MKKFFTFHVSVLRKKLHDWYPEQYDSCKLPYRSMAGVAYATPFSKLLDECLQCHCRHVYHITVNSSCRCNRRRMDALFFPPRNFAFSSPPKCAGESLSQRSYIDTLLAWQIFTNQEPLQKKRIVLSFSISLSFSLSLSLFLFFLDSSQEWYVIYEERGEVEKKERKEEKNPNNSRMNIQFASMHHLLSLSFSLSRVFSDIYTLHIRARGDSRFVASRMLAYIVELYSLLLPFFFL